MLVLEIVVGHVWKIRVAGQIDQLECALENDR